MKCLICGAPLEVRVLGATIAISKYEKAENLSVNLQEAFGLSDTEEPITVVCSQDPTHKQLNSAISKLTSLVAARLAAMYQKVAQRYYC